MNIQTHKKRRTFSEIKGLLPRIRKIIEDIYGTRLKELILYGSFAKNNATVDSDIDIMVVIKGNINSIRELEKMHDKLYDIELETGELIQIYPVSEAEFNNSIWPLYRHAKEEGIKI